MKDEEFIEKRLEIYREAFDSLVEKGTFLESFPKDDLLGDYLQKVIADNIDLLQDDPVWREVICESLLAYFYVLLQHIQEIERQQKEELDLLNQFTQADLVQKRALWAQICEFIEGKYGADEVNLEGYKQQLEDENKDAVLGALASDWAAACKGQTDRLKRSMLENSIEKWESSSREAGKRDYAKRLELGRFIVQYPALKEIVRIMGREKEENHQEKDSVIKKYLPSTICRYPSVEEIDRVEQGDNIPRVLPSELALMGDRDTEPLFYKRYAVKELQQLSSPGKDKPVKSDKDKNKPRLTKGPIVVAVDTSGSMSGNPIKIAVSMLLQLLRMAKKEDRNCFLITFSVQAKSLDLSRPGNWNKIESFLSDGYSGGSEGEQMLGQAMDVIEDGTFSMADVLIISDFRFPLPKTSTQDRMEKNRQKGTKFYGLQIGEYLSKYCYDETLDRIWKIE